MKKTKRKTLKEKLREERQATKKFVLYELLSKWNWYTDQDAGSMRLKRLLLDENELESILDLWVPKNSANRNA